MLLRALVSLHVELVKLVLSDMPEMALASAMAQVEHLEL